MPGLDLDELEITKEREKILIVDDDPDAVALLKITLRKAGMNVLSATNGYDALRKCADEHPDLVLLDIMMPGIDGWETYHRLREFSDLPIVVVSALGEKDQIVEGLQEGVDDYISKPFYGPEVIARVRTVLRRAAAAQPASILIAPKEELVINLGSHQVMLAGEEVYLSPKEFDFLALLMGAASRPVSYGQIASELWNGEENEVRGRIKYLAFLLRQKLESDPSQPELILNRPGVGYVLNVELQTR
jgi:DNA-binding response OmpR family regulator